MYSHRHKSDKIHTEHNDGWAVSVFQQLAGERQTNWLAHTCNRGNYKPCYDDSEKVSQLFALR